MTIFDFNENCSLSAWKIVDDGVMGGLSAGSLQLGKEGQAIFSGQVSLENNGGFSSLRHNFEQKDIHGFEKMLIRVKGDGKRYQFRAKSNRYERHAYIGYFETSGDWETITLNLKDLYPAFRGRTLPMDNFPATKIEEVAFLIGNKKAEGFQLEIDWIKLS